MAYPQNGHDPRGEQISTKPTPDKVAQEWRENVEDPWNPLLLSLDGGGIRGYSSLLILRQLMRDVEWWERKLNGVPDHKNVSRPEDGKDLLPCHYFDYMFGTSTGGLIALMLGRLRMSVSQCLDLYPEIGEELFGRKRGHHIPLRTKYHHKYLERAVMRIVRKHCKEHDRCCGDDFHPWTRREDIDTDQHICQSICITHTRNGYRFLRSYNHQYRNPSQFYIPFKRNVGADKLRIWQTARATTAAPFYFKKFKASFIRQDNANSQKRKESKSNTTRARETVIQAKNRKSSDGSEDTFKLACVDGGVRENNPASVALNEYLGMYGDDSSPALLMSVGTGRPDPQGNGFGVGEIGLFEDILGGFNILKDIKIRYTDGEKAHKHMMVYLQGNGDSTWYKRLNVDKSLGLGKMKLDAWEKGKWPTDTSRPQPGGKTLSKIRRMTDAYLTRDKLTQAPSDDDMEPDSDPFEAPKILLRHCAEKMVRARRAREATAHEHSLRWDTYTGRYLREDGRRGDDADTPVVADGRARSPSRHRVFRGRARGQPPECEETDLLRDSSTESGGAAKSATKHGGRGWIPWGK